MSRSPEHSRPRCGYYAAKLAAERLQRCYELATPAVKRYLEAEIEHLCARLDRGDLVLELGCGYGRVMAAMQRLFPGRARVLGIDSSLQSVAWGHRPRSPFSAEGSWPGEMLVMDAGQLGFGDQTFDVVACLQNGISAFHIDPLELVQEALRVTRAGGKVLLSTYAERFWSDRLSWFRLQAEHGLLGEIDEQATGSGVIVCRDGFRATAPGPEALLELARRAGRPAVVEEVRGSSLFLEIEA